MVAPSSSIGSCPARRALLLVDDEAGSRQRAAAVFREDGWIVRTAETRTDALEQVRATHPQRAVVEQRLSDGSGLRLVRDIKRLDPGIRVVVVTRFASVPGAVEALRSGALNYLTKPASAEHLLASFDPFDDDGDRHPPAPRARASAEHLPAEHLPTMAELQWDLINRVVLECDGNISRSARRLGLDARALRRKLFRGMRHA